MPERDFHEMQVGEWRFNVETNRLYREATEHQLSDKVCNVLRVLAEHPGRTVSRETLIQRVWNDNEYVGEQALTTAIWQLRKVFNDSSEAPEYIETIPKKGYRLLKSVSQVVAEPAATAAQAPPAADATEDTPATTAAEALTPKTASPSPPPRLPKRTYWLAFVGIGGLVLALAIGYLIAPAEKPPTAGKAELPDPGYWCGITAQQRTKLAIDSQQACLLKTESRAFGLVTGERMAALSDAYYLPLDGPEYGADIFFCDPQHPKQGKKANEPLNFARLKRSCAEQRNGRIVLADWKGQTAYLDCRNDQPKQIELETAQHRKTCSLPGELLTNRPNGLPSPENWFGLKRDQLQTLGIDIRQSCRLEAQDPTWIGTVELAWIWGEKQCQNIDGTPVGCGSVNHGMGAAGAVISDYYSASQLESLCNNADGPVELLPAYHWRNEVGDRSHFSASLRCEQGQPPRIQLAFQPVVGETAEHTCPIVPSTQTEEKP